MNAFLLELGVRLRLSPLGGLVFELLWIEIRLSKSETSTLVYGTGWYGM